MDRNFLIVAADGQVREAIASDLRERGFTVTLAENGSEALRVVQSVSVDSIVVESHLADMSCEDLRSRVTAVRPDCRVVTLTSYKLVRNTPELLRFGTEDFLLRGQEIRDLLRAPYDAGSDQGFWPWEERGNQALIQVIDVLVGLLELEHKLFASSSHQAMQLARATAEELGAHEDMVNEVVMGTLLRDVGKAGLELDHPADEECSPEERRKHDDEHVSSSLRLFEHIDFPWKVLPVVRHHHEHYNGAGGPDALRGREIPMGARIVAVVDAYVALTCGKQRQARDPEEALQELVRRAGHHFDPEVVEAFHRVIDKRLAGNKSKVKPAVLIVEPQKQFRRLIKMRLINEGLKVLEASGCEKAMGLLLKYPPDLVLVALDPEPGEAFQLLHEMQQDERLCRMPIAFLAQRPDRVLKLRALRLGVDDLLHKGDDMEELVARVQNILLRKAIRSEGEPRRTRRGISGSLDHLGLADMIQTLAIGMKTASVSIASAGRNGTIWFENGTPRHAETGDLEGEQAFYEMVRWGEGEFVIEHGVKTKRKSLNHDAMYLLMEGLRLLDEEVGEAQAAL